MAPPCREVVRSRYTAWGGLASSDLWAVIQVLEHDLAPHEGAFLACASAITSWRAGEGSRPYITTTLQGEVDVEQGHVLLRDDQDPALAASSKASDDQEGAASREKKKAKAGKMDPTLMWFSQEKYEPFNNNRQILAPPDKDLEKRLKKESKHCMVEMIYKLLQQKQSKIRVKSGNDGTSLNPLSYHNMKLLLSEDVDLQDELASYIEDDIQNKLHNLSEKRKVMFEILRQVLPMKVKEASLHHHMNQIKQKYSGDVRRSYVHAMIKTAVTLLEEEFKDQSRLNALEARQANYEAENAESGMASDSSTRRLKPLDASAVVQIIQHNGEAIEAMERELATALQEAEREKEEQVSFTDTYYQSVECIVRDLYESICEKIMDEKDRGLRVNATKLRAIMNSENSPLPHPLPPLEYHTVRRLMAFLKLHRQLVDDSDGDKEITIQELRDNITNIGEAVHVPEKPMSCLQRLVGEVPLVQLRSSTADIANAWGKKFVRQLINCVFDKLDTNREDGEAERTIDRDEWNEFIHPSKLPDSNELEGGRRAMKHLIQKDLVEKQMRVCSVDLNSEQLQELLCSLMGDKEVLTEEEKKELESKAASRHKVTDIEGLRECIKRKWKPNQKIAFSKRLKNEDEAKRIRTLIETGNLDQVRWGFDEEDKLGFLNVYGDKVDEFEKFWEDITRTANGIVVEEQYNTLRDVLHKESKGLTSQDLDDILELVRERAIEKDVFCRIYEKATGVTIVKRPGCSCSPTYELWAALEQAFAGQVEKKTFFGNCSKSLSIQAEGLGYALTYIDHRIQANRMQRHFLLYLLFVLVYAVLMQIDKGIAEAFYFGLAVKEAVGNDEIGSPSGSWFAQTFYDTANEDEFWDWLKGPLLETIYSEEKSPGTYGSLQGVDRTVGAIKLRQIRRAPHSCKGIIELLNHNTEVCNADGDPRKSTNWKAVREDQKNIGTPQPRATPVSPCLSSTARSHTNYTRAFSLLELSWEQSAVASEILRIIAEEKMDLYVNYERSGDTAEAILSVGNATTDVILDVWSNTRKSNLSKVTSTTTQRPGLYPYVSSGIYMNEAAKKKCVYCERDGIIALNSSLARRTFGNATFVIHDVDRDLKWNTFVQEMIDGHNYGSFLRVNYVQETGPSAYTSYPAYTNMVLETLDEPLFFYATQPMPFMDSVPLTRVRFPNEYDSSCWDPFTSTFTCDYPKEEQIKLVRSGFEKDYPDAAEFIHKMHFTQKQMQDMLTQMLSKSAREVACDWVKNNEVVWDQWLRQDVKEDILQRKNSYYANCFDEYEEVQDEESYYRGAGYLQEGLEPENTPRFVYEVENGEKTDKVAFQVPSREQFFRWVEEANNGNFTAETMWRKSQAWVYRECGELGGKQAHVMYPGMIPSPHNGRNLRYGCDGYGLILPISYTLDEAKQAVEELQANNWIDLATRGLMVEFFMHNQNSRHMSRHQYMMEVSSTGGWQPSMQANTWRLFQWETQAIRPALIAMIAFVAFCMYIFINQNINKLLNQWKQKMRLMKNEAGRHHGFWCPLCSRSCKPRGITLLLPAVQLIVSDFWIVYDSVMFSLVIISWYFRIRYMMMGPTDSNVLCTDVYPSDFETSADMNQLMITFDGVTLIFVFVKVVYFLQLDQDMNRIMVTISRSISLIAYILLVFLIVMIGFMVSGWAVFGTIVYQYRSYPESFYTLLFMMMGEFEFESMQSARPAFAMVFFLIFYIFIIAVLFNILIAVITAKYDEVYSERFLFETFYARIQNDPKTGGWDLERSFGVRPGISNSGVYREFTYQLNRIGYFFTCCLPEGWQIAPDFHTRNPRLFWPKYRKVLEELNSMELGRVIRAHLQIQLLAWKNKVKAMEGSEDTSIGVLKAESVADFIDELVGANRRQYIEFFLVELPARVMQTSVAREWYELLVHHNQWRRETEMWARMSSEDDEQANMKFFENSIAALNAALKHSTYVIKKFKGKKVY